MITYSYVVRDAASGDKVSGEIEADNERSAAKVLMDRGLSPLEIKAKGAHGGGRSVRHRVPTKQKIIFSRQLSTLINSGLPLIQSLHAVQKQTSNQTFKDIIGKVITDIEGGSTFGNALAKYPRLFNEIFISLIAAGEASGTLDLSLERLAEQQEKDAEIISRVRGAMIYPVVVLVVLLGVVVFMLVAVLPQVQSLYSQLPGAKLPFLTSVLLSISDFIINFWWVIILLGGALAAFLTRWMRTAAGSSTIDRLKMKIWPVGPLFMKLYMARFARTASTLVASGVPMIKMLETTARAIGNVHIEASIIRAIEDVKGGKALSDSLKNDPYFLDLVPSMISIGEQSGALDTMLGKLADYYEKEVDTQIKSISTIIEPVLMIIVGIIALIVVAAVLLPIYSLAGKNLITR